MAAKKRRSARKSPAKRTTSSKKGLAGKASAGEEMSLYEQALSAAPEAPEKKESRPYTSRYPVPEEQYRKLKTRADKTKTAKGKATPSSDNPDLTGETASAGALGIAPPPTAPDPPAAAPTATANFEGIQSTGWIPPDCTMAAGPQHVLLSVNSSVAIFNKTGGAALMQRTLTQWFANVVQDQTIFDPKVLYDQHAARWVVLAVAFRRNPNRSVFLLSVSTTANPLGTWRNHVLDAMRDGGTQTNNWADYPGLGVDSQFLYLTANMFLFDGGFQYAKIRVVPKTGPYNGGAVTFFDFVRLRNSNNTMAFTIQPCHTFGAPQVEYLVNSLFPQGNSITLWRITKPPSSATPVIARARVPTSPYSLPPNATQSGGPPDLNTGDVRIQHAVFRGDSIWTALTTNRNWGLGNRASVHWFQIRAATNALVQEGVFGTRAAHYSYPAACPDNNGNMIMVFSRSGTAEFGSIAYTGRRSTDPVGTLQSSTLLRAGVAHYQRLDSGGRNRWGDYNGIAADPANPRVIWFYSEFASAVNTWSTWVGSAFF